MQGVCGSVLQAIGATPLVSLDRLTEGLPGRVLAKLEYYNPGASMKDRVALAMVADAERRGELRAGSTVVELTSGNMGTGLALVCAVKGYKMVAVMSEGNTPERRRQLAALGARVVLVPQVGKPRPGQVSKEDLEAVEEKTRELVRKLRAFRPDQFHNVNSARAHESTTGAEVWRQSRGLVDVFLTVVGTGGSFVGVAKALKKKKPEVRAYAVEPASAPALAGRRIRSTSHKIQGAGYSMVPPLWEPDLCDGYLTVTDAQVIRAGRLLAKREGIFAGFSSGANVAAALKLAREAPEGTVIVTLLPDSGLKYLSTDLFP